MQEIQGFETRSEQDVTYVCMVCGLKTVPTQISSFTTFLLRTYSKLLNFFESMRKECPPTQQWLRSRFTTDLKGDFKNLIRARVLIYIYITKKLGNEHVLVQSLHKCNRRAAWFVSWSRGTSVRLVWRYFVQNRMGDMSSKIRMPSPEEALPGKRAEHEKYQVWRCEFVWLSQSRANAAISCQNKGNVLTFQGAMTWL